MLDGTGLLTVSNVPGLQEARSRPPLAQKFATLDEATSKAVKIQKVTILLLVVGKEKAEGKPDLSKGSYYANPQYDEPVSDPDLIAKYPAFLGKHLAKRRMCLILRTLLGRWGS